MPEVTVLMPMHNAEPYVGAAVESILGQTCRDFELLVVNDASTDRSREVVQSFADPRVRLVDNAQCLGIVGSLNRGLGMANGRFVARQDADDVSYPQRLALQIACLDAHARVALIGTQGHSIDDRGRRLGTVDRPCETATLRWYQLWNNPCVHTSVMFRRDVVREVGGYEAVFDGFTEDHALWSRILERYEAINLSGRLVACRVHANSIIERISTAQPGAPRRTGFERALARVIERNLTTVFGADEADPMRAALMARFATGLDAASIDSFLTLFARLRHRFEALHPAVHRSDDFRRTIARQYDAVACRIGAPVRTLAARTYAAALRDDPLLARWLPWLRAAALVAFGRSGRRRLRLLRRASSTTLPDAS